MIVSPGPGGPRLRFIICYVVETSPQGVKPPMLRGRGPFGVLTEVLDDYLGTLLRAVRELGPVVRIDPGPPGWRGTFYSVASPEDAAELLGQPDRYTKDEPGYREIKNCLGNGMLTSEGDVWLRQRRMLAPIFTRRRIAGSYVPIMVEEAQRVARRWRAAGEAGDAVDADSEMLELASRIIGRILFGSDMSSAMPEIMRASYVNHELMRRCLTPHPMPMWVPTPANRKLRAGVTEIRSVVARLIANRRAEGGASDDMLGLLLAASDTEGGGRLTNDEVIDQALTFLMAGHDTTASTLACAFAELARHPAWQDRVREELARELGDRPPTAEDLPRLVWTSRVIRETMRLYPASHSQGRSPVQDEVLGGYLIPAGSTVVVSSYALHRAPGNWEDPDLFDPARYEVPADAAASDCKHAWMAFGSGPHTCVGAQLATMETAIVLATILPHVELSTTLTSVPVEAAMTLKPARSLPLTVRSSPRTAVDASGSQEQSEEG